MAKALDPQLAAAIGERLDLARTNAGHRSVRAFAQALGRDDRLLRRYIAGESVPGIQFLIDAARECSVSIDWLVLGEEHAPAAYLEWLDSPLGQSAPAQARAIMRTLPLQGYRPTRQFYDLVFMGIRDGLYEEVTGPTELVRVVRETEQVS